MLRGKKILEEAQYLADLEKTIQDLGIEEKAGENLQKQKREELE